MGNGRQPREHTRLLTLMTIAVVSFVVDASVIVNPDLEETVAYSDIAQERYRTDLHTQPKRVVYEGDQVWRIYKHNDSVNDLVQLYDEYGCT